MTPSTVHSGTSAADFGFALASTGQAIWSAIATIPSQPPSLLITPYDALGRVFIPRRLPEKKWYVPVFQRARKPESTGRVMPVMQRAAGLQR